MNQKYADLIDKANGKTASAKIVKLMEKKITDPETFCYGLAKLATIGDEAAVNEIAHYLNNESAEVRLAACKAGIALGTSYMRTRVQYQLSVETDPATKAAIQTAFYDKFIK